jgi:hypothetical protein
VSHHLDSPLSREDPRLNVTDLYVFDGTRGTVLAMIVNTSLAGDARLPGFHPEARYEFKVHLDGAAHEGLTYRFCFGERGDKGAQAVTLHQLTGDDARDDAAEGTPLARGNTDEPITTDGGLRVWAGAARDPFYLDFNQLTSVIGGLQNRTPITFDGWAPETAASSFDDSRVQAIVLEVPTTDERLHDGRAIGVWGATVLATDAGGWRRTNRAAIPMVWPLFRAMGDSDDSEHYHADTEGHPADDRARDGDRVVDIVAAAAGSTGTDDPRAHAELVAARLLPDVLPYRVGTSAEFGFAGFNGRTLADNAPEVMYSLITNSGFPTGLTSADTAKTRADDFPYVVATS